MKEKEQEEGKAPSSELWQMPPPSGSSPMPSAPRKSRARIIENDSGEAATEPESSEEAVIPTIMMSRRQRSTGDYEVSGADVVKERPRHHTTSSKLQEAGAETAAIDVGDMQMQIVTHRRGNAIAELLKRVNVLEQAGAADEPASPGSSGRWRVDE